MSNRTRLSRTRLKSYKTQAIVWDLVVQDSSRTRLNCTRLRGTKLWVLITYHECISSYIFNVPHNEYRKILDDRYHNTIEVKKDLYLSYMPKIKSKNGDWITGVLIYTRKGYSYQYGVNLEVEKDGDSKQQAWSTEPNSLTLTSQPQPHYRKLKQ